MFGSPFRLLSFVFLLALFAIAVAAWPAPAGAQDTQEPKTTTQQLPSEEENPGGREVELVKPVIWSVREVYGNMPGDAWSNLVFFRADRIVLKKNRLTGKRGALLRWDIPLAIQNNGRNTRAGLGDMYLQDVVIPYLRPKFALGAGTGLTVPTATDARLGEGKWIASPIVAPIWFFRRKGFFLWKVQDYVSFAGDRNRRNVQRLSLYPIFVWRFHRRWWTQIEAESVTDFENRNLTWFRATVALGRMMNRRTGVWVKPEIAWGPNRPYDFALKVNMFSVKP